MVAGLLIEEERRDASVSASKFRLKRLVRRDLVSDVRQKGHKIVRDCFVVTYLENDCGAANVAVHVRKRFGNAVARNRVKRVFRASLQALATTIRGKDLIVTPRRAARGLGTSQIMPLLEKCLAEAGMTRKK